MNPEPPPPSLWSRQTDEPANDYQWALHEQMMTTVLAALDEFMKHPGRASLTDLTRLLDLASILGRHEPRGGSPRFAPSEIWPQDILYQKHLSPLSLCSRSLR